MNQYFIGIDGGATKCIVRIEDAQGNLIARETSGPANIRLSVEGAWASINHAIEKILAAKSITKQNEFYVGMGLAGCEVEEAYQAFIKQPHFFKELVVSSDSHAACLGAHQGQDGAIIIAGTGVVGFQSEAGAITKVGGWGFPHDDEGGGAWLGLEATKITLKWLDGRLPSSEIAQAVYQRFNEQASTFISWANQANSTAYAELAPIIIQAAQASDVQAIEILKHGAAFINQISAALQHAQKKENVLPCTLIGSITPFLEPYLDPSLKTRLRPALATPDAGAILLVRPLHK